VGGEFVGPTQDHVLKLIHELDLTTYPAYLNLKSVFIDGKGHKSTYSGDLPSAGVTGIVDLVQIITAIDQYAKAVPVDKPWTWSKAAEFDRQTADSLVRSSAADPQTAIDLVNLFFDSAYGATAAEVSALYVISQVAGFGNAKNVGSLERGISSKGGAQDSRIVGGSQRIAIRAAKHLDGRVVLNAAVRRIDQHKTGVTVHSDAGVWKGKYVIVATPPQLAADITWTPLMPPVQDAMRRRMTLGTLMKIHAVYDEPFWRKDPGVWMALKVNGVVPEMFDNTPKSGSPGVLMGFHGGHAWKKYANDPVGRRRDALRDFAEAFGPRALKPTHYFEHDWTAEEWSRGCPVSVVAPGVVTEFLPHLTTPFMRTHWAGTESATYWNGYMDGAISAGHRAAHEVAAKL
jgi:monoamine oxidase